MEYTNMDLPNNMLRKIRNNFTETFYRLVMNERSRFFEDEIGCDTTKQKLDAIKRYAVANSLHYAEYGNGVDAIGGLSTDWNFEDLPFLEKQHIRVGTVERLRVPGVKGWCRQTSGTTGLPVRVYIDSGTLAAQLAARWFYFSWYGLSPGLPEGRFWGRHDKRTVKAWCKDAILNRVVFQLDSRNPDQFSEAMKKLARWQPAYLYGYSSLLIKAAEEFDRLPYNRPRPNVIFSTAEMLSEAQREYISSIFGCPVVQEYGCSEVDIIAFECPNGRYHLNNHRLFVEFPENELGAKEVIVTDLDNRCTPLLRYRLGDLVEVTSEPCTCGRPGATLKKIVGRTANQLVPLPAGGFFHAVKFAHLVEQLDASGLQVIQYQVEHIQPARLVFHLHGAWTPDAQSKIRSFLKEKVGELFMGQAEIEISFGPVSFSGKNSYYVRSFKAEY